MNWYRTDIETALSAGGGLCIGNELTVAVGALTLLSAAIHKKSGFRRIQAQNHNVPKRVV